jgi:hypothetical protein
VTFRDIDASFSWNTEYSGKNQILRCARIRSGDGFGSAGQSGTRAQTLEKAQTYLKFQVTGWI